MKKNSKIHHLFILAALIFTVITAFSCKTLPRGQTPKLSRRLLDLGLLSPNQLADFFIANNPDRDYEYILTFASYYVDEAMAEGINSDLAFAQMCLETGFLRFGGLVQEDFHNYCGLGAMDSEHPGEKFENEEMGVRAHIQHLQAYATTEDVKLNKDLIDPRYNWVHKTKLVEDLWGLAGTWASDPAYGQKLNALLERMENQEY